ncbi:hypothetical protein SLA2020_525250 [Shorea laevis]
MKCQPQTITNTRTHNFHGIEPKTWNLQGWKIKLTSRPATEQPTKIHSNTETALNVHSLSGFVCLRLDVQFKHAISFEGGELADVELLDLQRRVSFSFCGNPTLLGEDFPCMFIGTAVLEEPAPASGTRYRHLLFCLSPAPCLLPSPSRHRFCSPIPKSPFILINQMQINACICVNRKLISYHIIRKISYFSSEFLR